MSSNGTLVANNLYDCQSRRIAKLTAASTNAFAYDGWLLISEIISHDSSLSTNSYVWGLDLSGTFQGAGGIGGLLATVRGGDPEPVEGFACYDANGNITDYVDTSGSVVAHREFDAYGNTTVASGTLAQAIPFCFSSKYFDKESGLYYYGYRYYALGIGRWLSQDPLHEVYGLS